MQKLKTLAAENRNELWELIRYIVAGALTTVLSYVVSNGMYFLLAVGATARVPAEGLLAHAAWVIDVINEANPAQTIIGTAVSWVIAVLFAFWINRRMVFRVHYAQWRKRMTALFQFAGARVASFLLFEQGLFQLLKIAGMENVVNRIVVLVLVIVFNYVASKFWIFKEKRPPETET
jgi:putative flippase GtrA